MSTEYRLEITARIPATRVRSLLWQGDELKDWTDIGRVYRLNGTSESGGVNYAYRFDSVVASPSGRYVVLYERLGTKALLLEGGKILRELNRSFYCADVHEYPVALFTLPDERDVVVHCPEEYNVLQIEDAETGERLTARDTENSADFFHSRLAATPDGRWLVSAGWFWHPFDTVRLFSIQEALADAAVLDVGWDASPESDCEINAATFVSDRHLILASSPDAETFKDEEEDGPVLRRGTVAVYDLEERAYLSVAACAEPLGTLFMLDEAHILSLYDHPKIVQVTTGEIVARLPDVKTGRQNSSIIHGIDVLPPMAFDATNRRLAVFQKDEIVVVSAVQ